MHILQWSLMANCAGGQHYAGILPTAKAAAASAGAVIKLLDGCTLLHRHSA